MINFYEDFYQSQHLEYVAQQHPQAWSVFPTFLAEEQFSIIIEIGTGSGGFTEYIKDLGYSIISYDVEDRYQTHASLITKGIDIRHKQVFNENYTILDNEVISLLQGGKALVLCDGVQKASEFNLISQHIKQGDVIMAHDYCVDYDTFNDVYKEKEWRWLELVETDIQIQCASLGLVSHQQETFDSIFWVCKKKPTS
jgi:hypothetical protein